MRCVFDTDAIISAMLSRTATPGVALASAYGTGEILVSVPLMRELHDVVSRPKFDIGAFIERYNNGWLLQRHGYMTPARAREKLSRRAA